MGSSCDCLHRTWKEERGEKEGMEGKRERRNRGQEVG